MKHAAAMEYGGELVAAEDCNYESFHLLKPLCPNCKEGVYLRSASNSRSKLGKAFVSPAAWCHFRGISDEQIASCENRVNNYTEKDRHRIASKARGQRLKLMQRWLWCVYEIWTPNPVDEPFSIFIEWFRGNTSWASNGPLFVKYSTDSILEDREGIAKVLRKGLESLRRNCSNAESEHGQDPSYAMWRNKARLLKGADFELHYRITLEVIDFLASPQNRNKLLKDILIVSYMRLLSRARDRGQDIPSGVSNDLWDEMMQIFIASLFTIPWASEFQRLEAESQQRKGAA